MKYFILSLLISSYLLRTECVYKLVWSDEFNGNTLDTSVWNYDTGDQWYNNELQGYTPSNVYVQNGNLRIEAKRETYMSKSYTSGRINSMHKKFFTYGRFEARMKFPTGTGFWPAFWLWPESWIESSYREIDIMEAVGHEKKLFIQHVGLVPLLVLHIYQKDIIWQKTMTWTIMFMVLIGNQAKLILLSMELFFTVAQNQQLQLGISI